MIESLSQKTYRAKEAMETVLKEDNKGQDRLKLIKNIVIEKGKLNKFLNFLRLLDSLLPKNIKPSTETLKKLFYNKKNLPFDPEKFRFEEMSVGSGSEVRVYLLESKTDKPSIAIKIYRPSKKKLDLVEQANTLKEERAYIANIYSTIPDLIPIEDYIVMEDPFSKGRPCTTIIEEFIAVPNAIFFLV